MKHFNTTHGHASRGKKSPTYKAWESMIRRCTNPRQQNYALYGAKGITVCERWRWFENFLADMGEMPKASSLDRVDFHGHYEPGNCRWVTMTEQQRNRRNNRLFTHDGLTMTAAAWSERTGIPSATIRSRIDRYGWSEARALTTPHRTRAEACRAASAARWSAA